MRTRPSTRLARQYGLEVTGVDLDPTMVTRARANADCPETDDQRYQSFWSATWPR